MRCKECGEKVEQLWYGLCEACKYDKDTGAL